MSSPLAVRKPSWGKRIGSALALWAGVCSFGWLLGMSPRPLLLAGLIAALSTASWLTTDSIRLAQPTDWHLIDDHIPRVRGADARVVTLQRQIADNPDSASSRAGLHALLTDLADERLQSLRGIDRESDPVAARAILGPELDDFMTSRDPTGTALSAGRIAQLLNRIESL